MISGVAKNYDYPGTCCQGDAKIYVIVVVVVRWVNEASHPACNMLALHLCHSCPKSVMTSKKLFLAIKLISILKISKTSAFGRRGHIPLLYPPPMASKAMRGYALLELVPVDSAMAGAHRDCPVLASVAQWPEILHLVSRGQIVSADLL